MAGNTGYKRPTDVHGKPVDYSPSEGEEHHDQVGERDQGCAYGAPTKKPYRLWMTPATAHEFMKVRIEPHDERSECSICRGKPNARHTRAAITGKGSKRKRTDTPEANGDASRNRVPWKLAKQVGQCMKAAYLKTSRG